MMLAKGAALLLLFYALSPSASRAVWINVPFVAQPRDGCGAASVAMVMQYWAAQQHQSASASAEVAAIQQQVFSRRKHGATPGALEAYLHQHGFLVFGVQGSWQLLQEQLQKGRPLIVALRPPAQRALHYVVIVGIDPIKDQILMNDPEERKLLPEGREEFEKDWSATHQWMLLAVPRPASS
jgi:ABC-type bacteriocin/lantibiotic exporter with double-glycine peptidase domain